MSELPADRYDVQMSGRTAALIPLTLYSRGCQAGRQLQIPKIRPGLPLAKGEQTALIDVLTVERKPAHARSLRTAQFPC